MAASVVIIEEQTGRRRRVELSGGALPIQGATWSGLNTLPTAWNPGNAEGVQHVLGPQEVPSKWDFVWRTTIINRAPVSVTDPEQGEYTIERAIPLMKLLEDIARGCALLKVIWVAKAESKLESSYRIVRIGRVETWDAEMIRADDVNCSVTFSWIGRGEEQPKTSNTRAENLNANINAAINASDAVVNAILADAIQASMKQQVNTANTFSLGQLEAIANGPREMMESFARVANGFSNRLKQIGQIIQTVKETPAAILGQIVDVANNAVSVCNQFVDQFTREGIETQSTRLKVDVLLQNASYFGRAQTQAEYMAEVMEKLAEAARRRQSAIVPSAGSSRRQDKLRNEDSFQVHIPKYGETMFTIAKQYYGNADLADELAIANGLPGYTIVPPKIPLIVPTRRNLDEVNRNRV